MKLIFNSESCNSESDLLEKFEKVYETGFPDRNERELFHDIINRVIGIKKPVEPHSIIVIKNDDNDPSEVCGGLIADWYEKSKCIHLTYLIIDSKFRGNGIGAKLINEGIALIKDWIKNNRQIEIRNVFFESNNPELTKNDNFDPYKRLEIFSKLGARLINIPYIQPALDPEKKDVKNLLLLTFPQFNVQKFRISTLEIIDFLTEFYDGLEGSKESLSNMVNSLKQIEHKNGYIETETILESNEFEFFNTSVSMHFVEHKSESIINPENNLNNYLASFEADMLNFRNQKRSDKDFKSTFVGNYQAMLHFPKAYTYCSEGIKHYKITDSKRLKIAVSLSISYTLFTKSGLTLWHLTITPAANCTFSENDLIKLVQNFGSNQENTIFSNPCALEFNNEKEENDIRTIIEKLFKNQPSQSGIIQIDPAHFFKGKDEWTSFSNLILKERNSIIDNDFKKISKTLCGIILGIFDFERMNEDEIFDTIQPVTNKNTSFVILCRGTLLKMSYNEEICNAVANHIIVDPYLLIPNMVLTYNTYILTKTLEKINDALNPDKKHKLNFLEKCQREIRNTLSFQVIYDIFHYPSEREIIKTGEIQRGIESLNFEITKRLNDLSELILVKRGNKTINSDATVTAFLAFISLFQLTGAITDFKSISLLEICLFAFELLLAIGIYVKLSSKKIRNEKT